MPHLAGDYINSNILPKVHANPAYPITHAESALLEQILSQDAKGYYYSACISAADALHGCQSGFYSWSTVKFYYVTFYLIRALLALNGWCVFYDLNKPRLLQALPGAVVSRPPAGRANTTTHGVVLNTFRSKFSSHPLISQEIAGEDPLNWLKLRREEANYHNNRFPEPVAPDHMLVIKGTTIRILLNAYMQDNAYNYEFDEDHAIMAFPIKTLATIRNMMISKNCYDYTDEDRQYLGGIFFDNNGIIAIMRALFV